MAATTAPRVGLFRRLYRGDANLDFIGTRKRWYIASAIIILICIASMVFRGFNFGIDFVGGDQFQLPVKAGTTISQVRTAATDAGAVVNSAQTAGTNTSTTYVVQTSSFDTPAEQTKVLDALAQAGKVDVNDVTFSSISGTWGGEITKQAVEALIVFLIVVSIYISLRFRDWRMALAALGALIHDLLLTAGVYSLVGFEVTPSTVVGLLTILGFSLYDTVVVFDKVDENSRGILGASRLTYGEAANLAVNQTLMRSINTSLIGLLPVAGLLFVGAGLLGVGTLEDLALVLFVGMLTGAYSSLFLATPWLVDLKMLDARYKNHAARVISRRSLAETKAAEARSSVRDSDESDDDAPVDAMASSGSAPRVGAKPSPQRSTTGPRRAGARPSGNRPGSPGGKRRA
jgi:preprotein translocase subunit SecF